MACAINFPRRVLSLSEKSLPFHFFRKPLKVWQSVSLSIVECKNEMSFLANDLFIEQDTSHRKRVQHSIDFTKVYEAQST